MSTEDRFELLEIGDAPLEVPPPPGLADEADLVGRTQTIPRGGTLAVAEVIGEPGRELGRFTEPRGLCLDHHECLYVADSGMDRVQKISPAGEVWGYTGGRSRHARMATPVDVAVDGRGMLYILERAMGRVRKIGPKARYEHSFGSRGSARGQLLCPEGLALDDMGNVWVADTGNHRVAVFHPSGRMLAVHHGQDAGGFSAPRGIGATPAGEIVVCDTGKGRLVVLDRGGAVVRVIGGYSSGRHTFHAPVDVAHDTEGRLWVVDELCGRLVRLDTEGNYLVSFGPILTRELGRIADPASVVVRADGGLYVCDRGNNRILRLEYRR